jgi:hypothetical protein
MRVFLLGYPGDMAGANTECAHTLAVWRQAGIDVAAVPTWGCDEKWEGILAGWGIPTHHSGCSENLAKVPGFAGSIVVGMCNSNVMAAKPILNQLGCKLVWANCMTFMFDHEIQTFRHHGLPAAFMFQSKFQQAELTAALEKLGMAPNGFLIRGAFDFNAIPFNPRPHAAGEEFLIGRLSRPDEDKWSSNHWNILGSVPYDVRRSLNMGWTLQLARKCGQPPPWAECLNPMHITVKEFLGRCHTMVGLNGGAKENWPRIGLESMAAGVPLVCQNLWGWREMIRHGETGFLCDNDNDMRFYLALLARDERLREKFINQARAHVERIADPKVIGQQWKDLFASLEN